MHVQLGRWTHAVLRIAAGLLFLQHGLQKVFALFGGVGGTAVPLASQLGVAGLLELFGGILLIGGFLTRPVTAILCLEMISAFLIAHLPQGGWPIQNQGELALLYLAIFVFLAGNGAGPLSVDSLIGRTYRNRRHAVSDRRHEPRVAA